MSATNPLPTGVSILRPGYLVSVKTSVKGNTSYQKQDLGFLKLEGGGTEAEWNTIRRVKDEEEQERASEVRSKARSLIQSICSYTEFGYLCPEGRKPELDKAVVEARNLVREFNKTSRFTRVRFTFATGFVADNDEVAIKAMNQELADLLEEMKEGIEGLDVKRVRDAADKATQVGQMLSPETEVRIALAVKTAREVAKRMVKAGEQAAVEIDRAAIARLTETRTAFLDLDQEEREIETPNVEARAIDLEVPGTECAATVTAPTRTLEIG